MQNRTCKTCRAVKPLGEFYRTRGYHRRECKPCYLARQYESEAWQRRRAKRATGEYVRRPTFYDHACETCGLEWSNQNKESRFCSLACRDHEARQKRMPVHVGPSHVTHLPDRHPALTRAAPRTDWWKLIVSGPCGWCGEAFTAVAASSTSAPRYCSGRCSKAAGRKRRGRLVLSPVARAAIYERDGWVCQLCGDPVDAGLDASDPWAATLDHVVPRSWTLLPDDSPRNLRLAHRWCNSVRGDETYYTEEVLRCV